MPIDLMAGTTALGAATESIQEPTILLFDSGLGGLTVFEQVRRARPDARYLYVADDAAFPYGRLPEPILIERVIAVMERLIGKHAPDLVVVACNTASTLVLPSLRERFTSSFVGVVPPIKPAAAATRSSLISLLATPGTVARAYTHDLIATYASACNVTLVGAPNLANFAEAELTGSAVDDEAVSREIAGCFVTADDGRRTDVVCLACTHYPLLLPRFELLAPWPVTWIDPAPAIAKRVLHLLGASPPEPDRMSKPVRAIFTGGEGVSTALRHSLASRGLREVAIEAMPLSGIAS